MATYNVLAANGVRTPNSGDLAVGVGEGVGGGGGVGGGSSGVPKCVRTHCHFFVGPGVVTTTRDGYGHSDRYEWTRAWWFEPTDLFVSHAPPVLAHFQSASSNGMGAGTSGGAGGGTGASGGGAGASGGGSGGGSWKLYGRPASDETPLDEAAIGSACMMPDEAARRGIGFSHYAYVNQVRE